MKRSLFFFYFSYFFLIIIKAQVTPSSITWKNISTSMWIGGSINSNLKPLQYNKDLNVVSFIQPKSPYYMASPQPTSNAEAKNIVVAMISQNWGNTWDSTCMWNNSTFMGLNPQGAICNPIGNTNLSNALIVAGGGALTFSSSAGIWLSNKPLGVYTNSVSSAPNTTLHLRNTPPYHNLGKFGFWQYGFSSTTDGKVRTIASTVANSNLVNSINGFRGAKLLTGTLNSGSLNWTVDTFLPNFNKHTVTNQNLAQQTTFMAWNDSGTVGYVWFIGSRFGSTGNNIGYQPIVYKTINSGSTWQLQADINFNSTLMAQKVLKYLDPVKENASRIIPYFNEREGIDGVVDNENQLHLVSTLLSTKTSITDSLTQCHTYSLSSDNESGYSFGHVPGRRPYIFDFTLKGNTWDVMLIDSMSTESPGHYPADPGVNDNPWDFDPVVLYKINYGARIQLSKSKNGEFIIYSWTETDTIFTNGVRKWNSMPDIKARCFSTCLNELSFFKKNITTTDDGFVNPAVSTKAFMHYIAPNCTNVSGSAANGWGFEYEFKLPMIVSNSNPLSSLQTNQHWFSASPISFLFSKVCNPVGLNERNGESFSSIWMVYPNPVNRHLTINTSNLSDGIISIADICGRELKVFNQQSVSQQFDVSDLERGIYIVSLLKEGKLLGQQKIIKE